MNLPASVSIVEVGPRDGLQGEARHVASADKIALINRLSACGLRRLEVSSFVSAKAIPQLADAAEVLAGIERAPGARYSVLVANERGYDNAMAAGADEVAVFLSASEAHNQRNVGKNIADTLAKLRLVARRAAADGVPVRGYVSTVFGCSLAGKVEPAQVGRICGELADMGVGEISLGDTIGVAYPPQVQTMVEGLGAQLGDLPLALHLHDTLGRGLANVWAGLEAGIRVFDSSVGGLGGCPNTPGGAGNIATEDLVSLLRAMGIACGVEEEAIRAVARFAALLVDHPLASHCAYAGGTAEEGA